MRAIRHRKAPLAGAFLLLWLLAPALAAAPACPADHVDERASVRHVIDGDTLVLGDGRHVRFAGIDAPEIGHEGRPSQPFAEAARARVMRLFPPGATVALRHSREPVDHYGRLLAHLYLPDGESVEADLLARGLAVTLVVPPNVWAHACYQRVEDAARAAARGVWSLPRYRPVETTAIARSARGFRIVRGRVRHVGESRRSLWLDLDGRFALRIPKSDLGWFAAPSPRRLLGRRVEARGWIHAYRGTLEITVRHPAALTVLP